MGEKKISGAIYLSDAKYECTRNSTNVIPTSKRKNKHKKKNRLKTIDFEKVTRFVSL
jgi:hypothetical protein